MMSIDRNNLCLLDRGYKLLVREVVPLGDIPVLMGWCFDHGWHIEVADRPIDAGGRYDGALDNRIVYISKRQDIAILGVHLDFSLDPSRIAIFWKLLGYPPCCVNFFIRFGQLANFDILSLLLDRSKGLDKRLNILDHPSICHIPCSFDCKPSRELSTLFSYNNVTHWGVYVVFRTMFWVHIGLGGEYRFGSYFRSPSTSDPRFERIRQALSTNIAHLVIEGRMVALQYSWVSRSERFRDVLVLDFT